LPDPIIKIRSFVAWCTRDGAAADAWEDVRPELRGAWREWRGGSLTVRFAPRALLSDPELPAPRLPLLILGDDADRDPSDADASMGSGVSVRYDSSAQEFLVNTSIVALPPVFLYQDPRTVAVSSDLHLLANVPHVRLELLPSAVVELGHFGHPVGHRTLFRHVELVPGGSRVSVNASCGATFRRTWRMPEATPLSWQQYREAQIDAFTRAVGRLGVERSFLSLTAGLDTRAIFSALAAQQRLIPAATMTGPHHSLDARIAARLCRAYGVRHDAVTFDEQFTRNGPRYVETASRLSGGLASIDQAPEVFLYDQLGQSFTARLSGNLGNQVGRGGTEGVSVRAADITVLAPRLREGGVPTGHWLLEQLDRSGRESIEFILQSEVPYTLLGNFSVGNHFATQQSPYASRGLIETLALRPASRAGAPSDSKLRMRLRDLRHRFLGESEAHSFQRTLVNRLGGFAAQCPVNWGWRPDGGISPAGFALGTATLLGMVARAKGLDGGVLRRPFELSGLPALHDFRESQRWLRSDLREFTLDTLTAHSIQQAELFDVPALTRVLDDHFQRGRDHYSTVSFALDVALAHRILCN